jgi:hypothetical protein
MPYLRVTCPAIDAAERRAVAETLTSTLVELFTPSRGPGSEEIRARTTVQFACYQLDELFVGGVAASPSQVGVTTELSDWHMIFG